MSILVDLIRKDVQITRLRLEASYSPSRRLSGISTSSWIQGACFHEVHAITRPHSFVYDDEVTIDNERSAVSGAGIFDVNAELDGGR